MERTMERVERRVTAILMADVVGYSRLIGADDEGTFARLNAHHNALVNPKIEEHCGRVVRTTGDGLLVLFASTVDALHCAVEVQRGMIERNAEVPPGMRIEFRMGISVGDIIVDGGSIHGDGVNVAARLEAMAEPGGICVSDRVQEDLHGSLDIGFQDRGQQRLKNIARPVRVYHVRLNGTSVEATSALPDKSSIAVMLSDNMSGAHERRRRAGEARAVPRRAVLAGASSMVVLGLGGPLYMLWPPSFAGDAKFAGTRRTALVIGNAQYRNFPRLDNPVRDADSVSVALEQRGFRVIKVIDADGQQTAEAFIDFERTLSVVGGVGIFYYAGRAMYIDGEDILMPVDAKLNSAQTKLEGGVNLTTLQAQVQAKITRKFVSDGSAVIYSASKGQNADDGPPGKHSPFTTAFLEALTHDEDELGDLFRRIRQTMVNEPSEPIKKQTPYFEDSRTVKYHFNRPETDVAIGALKVLIFDSCRDNPFKSGTDGKLSIASR
jgi:class 3 adenylate cyclase